MKKVALILIVVGLIISLYPVLKVEYTTYIQNKVLQQWESELDKVNSEKSDQNSIDKKVYNSQNIPLSASDSYDKMTTSKNKFIVTSNDLKLLGLLEIESIEAKLPIFEGNNEKILNIGVGWMDNTSHIGKKGNTVLSAHRSHTYGRLFNRLNEVKIGDTINVRTLEKNNNYTVYAIEIVEPDDITYMDTQKYENVLTLTTCHPLYVANQRLIVKAHMN